MQELLARLKALDPNASMALRVIACFDELVRGGVNTQALLGAAASLSGCVAGYAREAPAATMRVAPNGEVIDPTEATDEHLQHHTDGLRVWLERPEPRQANDAIILERLALALDIRLGRTREDPLRRMGALLDASVDKAQRSAAAANLGLAPRGQYRVVAMPLFATWSRRPEMIEDVVPTRFGPLHVGIVPAEVTRVDARPCGVGAAMSACALHRSFSTAIVSLRLCAPPDIPTVVADEYGGLVEILAQCSVDQPLLDVEELAGVMLHPWAASTLDALLKSGSVREASRLAGVHHSTMQTRLETVRDALPFDPLDGIGRTRIGLAFLAWRLRHSAVLELPAPSDRH